MNPIPSSFTDQSRMEEPPSMASQIHEALRHPDATRLYPVLKALQGHGDLDDIEYLGSRFEGASPTQQVAIRDWRETLDTPQRDAFEKGRARRESLDGGQFDQDTLKQCLSEALKNTHQWKEGQADHLRGLMDRMLQLKADWLPGIHEEVFREIQGVPSSQVQTELLLKWVGSLWLMSSGAQAADISDLFLKAWERLLGLNQGVLNAPDFVLLVDSLAMMRGDDREKGVGALWQYAEALSDPGLQQHALQTLQALSSDQVSYVLRTELRP